MITNDQVGGIVRSVLAVVLGYAAGRGIIASGAVADLAATVSAAVIAGWSAYTNRPKAS
jgi:hypothetical protein